MMMTMLTLNKDFSNDNGWLRQIPDNYQVAVAVDFLCKDFPRQC